MSTKNDPGAFDCYANAAPDEPMFVLLGRDPAASFCVALWMVIRKEIGANVDTDQQIQDADKCLHDMAIYAQKLGKTEAVVKAFHACGKALETE